MGQKQGSAQKEVVSVCEEEVGASRRKETPQELGSFIYFPGFWCFDIWGLADPGETAPPRFRQFLETPQDSLPATLSYAKQPTQRPPPTASLSGSSRMQAQSCLALYDPMDHGRTGPSVRGLSQARILEQLPFPSPGDLPHPGNEVVSIASSALAGRFFTTEPARDCWSPRALV